MKVIGKIAKIDFEALDKYRRAFESKEGMKEFSLIVNRLKGDLYKILRDSPLFKFYSPSWSSATNFDESCQRATKLLKATYDHYSELGREFDVIYKDDSWVLILIGSRKEILPICCVQIREVLDYEKMTIGEVKALLPGSDQSCANLTEFGNEMSIAKKKEEISASLEEIKAKELEEKEKIRAIEEAMKAQIDKVRKEMELKLDELKQKKDAMEKDLFKLDTELYTLRCLLGDCVDVIQLRNGKKASIETPVVFFQKLRFLDEDLAKMEHLYNIDFTKETSIEKCLKLRDDVFETFCPSEKCVVVIKISKENKSYFSDPSNLMEWTHYENGNRIAILVRNGENLHIVWTEEERIFLKENLILSSETKTVEVAETDAEALEDEAIVDDDFRKGLGWKQYFSRRFIFTILQGLMEYKRIIELPEKVNLAIPTPYVIFSTAENQLTDTRFGNMSDYIKWMNRQTEQGDVILPLQSINGCFTERDWWGSGYHQNHDRGRGSANRVHDASIKQDIDRINFVENPSHRDWLYLPTASDYETTDEERLKHLRKVEEEFKKAFELLEASGKDRVRVGNIVYEYRVETAGRGYVWIENERKVRVVKTSILKTEFNLEECHYYVSCEKERSERGAKANVEILPEEFLNLTFVSSQIIRFWLETKQVGSYIPGNYAYIVKHLRKALDFLVKREEDEFKMLQEEIGNYPLEIFKNLPGIILAYRIKNDIHHWTKRSKKKFVNWLMCECTCSGDELLKEVPWKQEKEEEA